MMRSPGGLAGNTPRFSRGSAFGRLAGFLRRPAQPRSPGRGWLRPGTARRTTLGRGGMGRGGMGRGWTGARTPGLRSGGRGSARLRMSRPKKPRTRRRWRTGGYL
jgi:hypothetical protein